MSEIFGCRRIEIVKYPGWQGQAAMVLDGRRGGRHLLKKPHLSIPRVSIVDQTKYIISYFKTGLSVGTGRNISSRRPQGSRDLFLTIIKKNAE